MKIKFLIIITFLSINFSSKCCFEQMFALAYIAFGNKSLDRFTTTDDDTNSETDPIDTTIRASHSHTGVRELRARAVLRQPVFVVRRSMRLDAVADNPQTILGFMIAENKRNKKQQ